MSAKEFERVRVISSCVRGELACAKAAEMLDLTPRHVKRLKARYRQGSAAALAHASRGRPSSRRLPEPVRERIVRLARSRYTGLNDHHLWEKLCDEEGFSLSRETLRRLLRAAGVGSPRKRRLRSASEGQIVLLDGSPRDWLEGRGPQLTALGFQDDASGKILVAEFLPAETPESYFSLLDFLLRRYGVPVAFHGGRQSIFVRNDDHWTVEEQLAGKRNPTQLGRALEQLGITYIPAQSPQTKGRVERIWSVLEDRLTSELRLAQACDPDSANRVLRRFVADYNRRFARTPRDSAKAWRPAPGNLDRICCFRHECIVGNNNVVQWDGRRLRIPPQSWRFSFAGAKVQLHQTLDGRILVYYGESRLELGDPREVTFSCSRKDAIFRVDAQGSDR